MLILERIDEWRSDDRRGAGGRPETFSFRALLVAMVLCVTTDQPLLVTQLRNVLFSQISPAMRAVLGVPEPPGRADRRGWAACYRNVRTRMHALLNVVDPSVLPKNRRLSAEDFQAAVNLGRSMRSEEECEMRRDRLGWLVNEVLEASIRMIPREYRRRWKGSVAVDATVVETFARPERRVRGKEKASKRAVVVHSADPDAAWYHREPDGRDADATPKRDSVWGYELSIAVAGSDDPGAEASMPSVVVGMAPLHRPGHDPGPNAVIALASVQARGHPAQWLAADRAYTNAKAENFQLPTRALGYRPVLDYKVDQLGVQDSYGGLLMIEGAWYCPSMPDVLVHATRDYRNGTIDDVTYCARLNERWLYLARAKTRADAEGHERVCCPAAKPHPVARCDLKPASLSLATRGKLRIPLHPDVHGNPPPICTQQSLTVPPEAGAKFRQDLLFGSPDWHAVYGTLRNAVEGFNGFVKDGAHEALDDPERRRLRGVAAQSVLVAFLLFGANLRKIAAFLAEEAAVASGTVRRMPRRRRTRSIETWQPESGGIALSSGPDPPTG